MTEESIGDIVGGLSNVKPVSEGLQNLVYEAIRADKKVILRLSEPSRRPISQIQAELTWIDYLSHKGMRVARAIQPPMEATIDGSDYYAVVFEHTNGRQVNVLDLDEWNPALFYCWGKMMAELHEPGAPQTARPAWLEENELQPSVHGIPWLQAAYYKTVSAMKAFKQDSSCFGLVHNDLHTGNFHLTGEGLVLFDFDDCGYHFFAQDLAVSIYHALWTGTSFHPDWTDFPKTFLHALLEGYRSVRPLRPEMYEQLLQCLKMREIFLYALFQKNWDHSRLEEWKSDKLAELERSIQSGEVPYEKELSAFKEFFYAG